MIGSHGHELWVEPGERPPASRRQLDGLAQHGRGRLGHRRPGELRADPPCLGARGGEPLGLVDVAADGVGERRGVGERDELAGPRREHVLRVPVRRRDDGAAGGDSEGERARGDLLAPLVRRDEDVGRGEQVGDLVDRQEAVVELDVVLEAEVEHRLLERQAVTLSLAVRHVGVRPAGDDVHHLGMALDDRRQRLDHRLDPLAGRDQPEGREQEPLARRRALEAPFSCARARTHRRAVRAPSARRAGRPEPCSAGHASLATSSRFAVSVITITSSAWRQSAASTSSLMRRRLREHGVQRDDERLRELLDERET